MRPRPRWRLLVRNNPMQKGRGGIRVGALQEDTAIMAEQPGLQRLHPNEVGDDDVLVSRVGQRRSPAREYGAALVPRLASCFHRIG